MWNRIQSQEEWTRDRAFDTCNGVPSFSSYFLVCLTEFDSCWLVFREMLCWRLRLLHLLRSVSSSLYLLVSFDCFIACSRHTHTHKPIVNIHLCVWIVKFEFFSVKRAYLEEETSNIAQWPVCVCTSHMTLWFFNFSFISCFISFGMTTCVYFVFSGKINISFESEQKKEKKTKKFFPFRHFSDESISTELEEEKNRRRSSRSNRNWNEIDEVDVSLITFQHIQIHPATRQHSTTF